MKTTPHSRDPARHSLHGKALGSRTLPFLCSRTGKDTRWEHHYVALPSVPRGTLHWHLPNTPYATPQDPDTKLALQH